MLRYLFRRCLQTIPTVIGVVLINFVLFNMIGESPALMVLGNKASAESLEEFDEVRGFNKPLLWGRRTASRIYDAVDFRKGIGGWSRFADARHDPDRGTLILRPAETYTPLAFAPKPDVEYEWQLEYRIAPGSTVSFFGEELTAEKWTKTRIRVTDASPLEIRVESGELILRSLELNRVVDHPFDSQLTFYLGRLLQGDFGRSETFKQPVSELLKAGILPSLSLTIPIFLIGLVVSVAMSLICAFFRNGVIDRFLVVTAIALMSINYLVFIVAGQFVLAFKLRWFPVWGYESWYYLVLPVTIGVISGLGTNVRFYRTIMLDEMYKDYVRTAFAKGVSKPRVLFVHVLKNAMIPIITNVVVAIPFLYTGSLLLETFFGIPGLGYLGINSILQSDVDVVRSLVLIGALLFVVSNLLTDICYALADPRVKLK